VEGDQTNAGKGNRTNFHRSKKVGKKAKETPCPSVQTKKKAKKITSGAGATIVVTKKGPKQDIGLIGAALGGGQQEKKREGEEQCDR